MKYLKNLAAVSVAIACTWQPAQAVQFTAQKIGVWGPDELVPYGMNAFGQVVLQGVAVAKDSSGLTGYHENSLFLYSRNTGLLVISNESSSFDVVAINNAGQVLYGRNANPFGDGVLNRYQPSGIVEVSGGNAAYSTRSTQYLGGSGRFSMNDAGQVLANLRTGQPVIYSDGKGLVPLSQLGNLPVGYDAGYGLAINNSGQATGAFTASVEKMVFLCLPPQPLSVTVPASARCPSGV